MRPNSLAAVSLAALMTLAAATAASAHAALVKSNPAASAEVPAPKVISLTFSEELTPAFSTFDLTTANGDKVAVKTSVAKDGKTVTGKPQAPLAPGAYKVAWRAAAADDGHKTKGTFAFAVK